MTGKITLVGGPADKATLMVSEPVNVCYPVQVNIQGQGVCWLTAVYLPATDGSMTATWSRTIQFADNSTVTPIDETMFNALLRVESNLLELGTGTTTWWLRRYRNGRVISIENNSNFYGMFSPWSDQIYVGLVVPGTDGDARTAPWLHYDPNILGRILTGVPYGALLVDGPDADNRIQGFVECRDIYNPHVDWYFDDYALSEDFSTRIQGLATLTGRKLDVFDKCKKPWAVLRAQPPVTHTYVPQPLGTSDVK